MNFAAGYPMFGVRMRARIRVRLSSHMPRDVCDPQQVPWFAPDFHLFILWMGMLNTQNS